jgi:hypothetical protein
MGDCGAAYGYRQPPQGASGGRAASSNPFSLEFVRLITQFGRKLEIHLGDGLFLGDVEPLDLCFELF